MRASVGQKNVRLTAAWRLLYQKKAIIRVFFVAKIWGFFRERSPFHGF